MIANKSISSAIQLKNATQSLNIISKRFSSARPTNMQILNHRAALFEKEKQRQLKQIERIEKIQVKTVDQFNKEVNLVMNKKLSTPLNCAMHISELLMQRSALALVNDMPWDMNRPLEESCTLKFMHFKDSDPTEANNAYWRSCSFLLGYLLETAFKDNHFVEICSFPPPDIKSGSFVYDVQLNMPEWNPTKDELRCLSIAACKLISKNLSFERLKIKPDIAEEMFKYNKYKLMQIPEIIAKDKLLTESDNSYITVYKLGDYVDISKGPMISNTSQMGRFSVSGIFNLDTEAYGKIQRVQGVSIPVDLNLHYWTFNLLADRAAKLNMSYKPFLSQSKQTA